MRGGKLLIWIHKSASPLLPMSSFRHSSLNASEIRSMSISLAHNEELASMRVRQLRHTCDVIRVVSRASSSANMSALSMKISSRTSSLSLEIGEDGWVDNISKWASIRKMRLVWTGSCIYKGPVAYVSRGLWWREGESSSVFQRQWIRKDNKYYLFKSKPRHILLLNACFLC